MDVSRKKIYAEVLEEVKTFGCAPSDEAIHEVVENRLRKEVIKGVQTIQYQVITLMTTNGPVSYTHLDVYKRQS